MSITYKRNGEDITDKQIIINKIPFHKRLWVVTKCFFKFAFKKKYVQQAKKEKGEGSQKTNS